MDQLVHILAIDKVNTTLQGLDCRTGLGWLYQVYEPNSPSLSEYLLQYISLFSSFFLRINNIYLNIFTRCTIRIQLDILLTAVADVSPIFLTIQNEKALIMRDRGC